jgi:membrane-bound lytic murein transglycosylase MltF
MHAVVTRGDDTTEEKTSTISYKFKSEETTVVGSCVLQAIHGEIDTTNDDPRTSHSFQVYFPELRIAATAVDAEPVLDSLSTVFSAIGPAN